MNAFKNRSSDSKRELVVDERHELERLIQTARTERAAMDETLLTMRARSASLKPIGQLLEHIDGKMTDVSTKLDEIGERLGTLDGRTRDLEAIDEHVQSLKDAAQQAEQTVQSALGADGELTKHREAVEHLSAQAQQTHSSLDALKIEHAALEQLRDQLRTTQTEVKQSVDVATALENELQMIRGMAMGLTEDCARLADTSRVAREDTAVAMTAIKDVEKKLGPLAQLQETRPEHGRTAGDAQRPCRARLAQGQSDRRPGTNRRTRPRSGQPGERDGVVDGGPDRQVERGHEARGDRR